MTDLIHGKQCGLRGMAEGGCTIKVTAVGKRRPNKGLAAAHHGVAMAPCSCAGHGC